MNKKNNFKAGQNGLPPVKAQYEENEKIKIAAAAKEYGLKSVAEAYGVKWQALAAWSKKKQNNVKPKIIIQSPTGQEITAKELKEKIYALDAVETAYVRSDENAVYWVRGDEHGSIPLFNGLS